MVEVKINANEIKNVTIKKLTAIEIGSLGLSNCGVYTYKGTPKCRVKGMKTTLKTEDEIHYENDNMRYEVIKIQDSGRWPVGEYALRVFNKQNDSYMEFYQVLIGCDFFK